MKHVPTSRRCRVWHGDGPACIRCAACDEWIRPNGMDQECPQTLPATHGERMAALEHDVDRLKKRCDELTEDLSDLRFRALR